MRCTTSIFTSTNGRTRPKPNDDAELARDAVIEGSAVAAMIDYILQGKGRFGTSANWTLP